MLLIFGLLLGVVWAIKAARNTSERGLVLAPSAVLALLWVITAWLKEDWTLLLFFGGGILCVVATFAAGHHLRTRRMREAFHESDLDI